MLSAAMAQQLARQQIAAAQGGGGVPAEPAGAESGEAAGHEAAEGAEPDADRMVARPDKVVRIAAMVRELLDETRQTNPDEAGRLLLRQIYERAVAELRDVLSEDLQRELDALAPPIGGVPTESEIRVAQAQLVGWLEGLFHGIQAAIWAQQMAARAQLEQMQRRGLPGGALPERAAQGPEDRSGQYL